MEDEKKQRGRIGKGCNKMKKKYDREKKKSLGKDEFSGEGEVRVL